MMALPHFHNIKAHQHYSGVIIYCKKCYNTENTNKCICDICGGEVIYKLITDPNIFSK